MPPPSIETMRRVAVSQRTMYSLRLDSVAGSANSGAPPPGYTSQRDATSSVAVTNDYEDSDDDEAMLNNSSAPPPSMESCRDAIYTLPSPYSAEDLRLVTTEHTQPAVAPHCIHGYTHTHSQCTPMSSPFKAGSHSNPCIQRNDFSTITNIPPIRSTPYYPPHQQRETGHTCDAPNFYDPHILYTDNLLGANGQSRFSLRPCQRSSAEEHPPILQAGNQHQHQQTTPPYPTITSNDNYDLSSSPYHHHHQNACQPPCGDIRILTYPSADEGACEYEYDYEGYAHEEEDEEAKRGRSPLNNKSMMNSTATIISPSEEPSGYQSHESALPLIPPPASHHRRLNLLTKVNRESMTLGPRRAMATTTRDVIMNTNSPKTITKSASKTPTTKASAQDRSTLVPLPTQTQPTNYVHLSRKCRPSKPTSKFWGWQRIQPTHIPPSSSSSSSIITGTFVIDPELYIPPGLLDAMEDPLFRLSSPDTKTENIGKTFLHTGRRPGSRRNNLRLEVENGGIDVDIRLVPNVSDRSGVPACTGDKNRGYMDTFCEDDVLVQAPVSASATRITFNGVGTPSPTETSEKLPRPPSDPHLSTSSSTIPTQKDPAQPSATRKEDILKHAVAQTSSTKRDRKWTGPTTIDLRIKQSHRSSSMPLSDSVKIKRITGSIPSPLIARIF
ncbi:hypothetical protein BYT27DRAFT_6493948 [Phlegmacium glaucopus]|nr:hypothetical protein BYT27DRAFT_6493948 [Phlegmacium glaucopus]